MWKRLKTSHMRIIFILIIIFKAIFTIGQDLKPNETNVLVKVLVTNFSNIPRSNEPIYFEGTNQPTVFWGITDNKGTFSILLPKNNTYYIKYRNFNDSVNYSILEVPADKGLYEFSVHIKIEPAKVYVLEDVYFDFGKATLRKESFKSLDNLVEILKIKNNMIIEIAGHTDSIGKAKDNLVLSEARANSVRNYLITKGIAPERLIAKGYGDTEPVADNSTEEGRQKNRRTEVRIIKE